MIAGPVPHSGAVVYRGLDLTHLKATMIDGGVHAAVVMLVGAAGIDPVHFALVARN